MDHTVRAKFTIEVLTGNLSHAELLTNSRLSDLTNTDVSYPPYGCYCCGNKHQIG